jgi:glutamate 5-kinase
MAKAKQRWVIKAGSNIVCSGGPLLVRAWMQQVSELRRKHGIEVIWVTSGAIASAIDRTGFKKPNLKLSEKQALSAIGQPLVMDLYNIALQTSGLLGAQILLTYSDLADSRRRENFHNTLEELLRWGVVPILNENDAVATEEIKFGDNDSLSAKVALVSQADRLLILTDVSGLYDSDPSQNPRARLIPRLNSVSPQLLKALEGSTRARAKKKTQGTGGMFSKIRAAAEACKGGTETWLVRGDIPSVLLSAAENRPVGTVIEARSRKRRKRK